VFAWTLILILLAPKEPAKDSRMDANGNHFIATEEGEPSIWGTSIFRLAHRGQRNGRQSSKTIGGGLVLLASGSYLEQMGQMSQVMNEFVDALLEKVSFLATIIIESSIMEECVPVGFSFGAKEKTLPSTKLDGGSGVEAEGGGNGGGNSGGNGASQRDDCRRIFGVEEEEKLLGAQNGSQSGGSSGTIERSLFDEMEYKNLDLFLGHYEERLKSEQQQSGCKVFTLDIGQQDLPVGSMESCCHNFGQCYAKCGHPKRKCDEQFRTCLREICWQNFNPKNETLLRMEQRGGHHLGRRHAMGDFDAEPLLQEDDQPPDGPEEQGAAAGEELEDDEDRLYAELDAERRAERRKRRAAEGKQQEEEEEEDDEEEPISSWVQKRLRDRYKACKLASKLLVIGNLAFSCQHYKEKQARACCSPRA